MKALVFRDGLFLSTIEKPARGKGESLIKLLMAGICNTDIEIVRGYMGFQGVLGHEFVGIVIDSDDPNLLNKRVVGEINVGCGQCKYCLQGLERHCPNRTVVGIYNRQGVFAEYLVLPDKNLHVVPDNVSDEEAVFVEPLAASLEIQEQIQVRPTDKIAIVGDGKLALLIVQVLKLSGAAVTVFGKHAQKLALCQKFGAQAAHIDQKPADKFDLVVEASGHFSGFEFALDLLKPRGTMVLKSTYHGSLSYNPAKVVIDELNIIGSRCGPFEPAIHLLDEKLVDVRPLITETFPFGQIEQAFQAAMNKDSLKILIDFRE